MHKISLPLFLFFTYSLLFLQKTNAQFNHEGSVILTNANIIPLIDDNVYSDQVIVIRQGRIADIFKKGKKPIPAGLPVMDLKGNYIIPGLIDAHYHILSTRRSSEIDTLLEYAFMGGVTAVREMASDAIQLKELSDRANSCKAMLPRIYYSALFGGVAFFDNEPRTPLIMHGLPPGTAPWAKKISDTTDTEQAVWLAKQAGVTGIKIYAELSPTLMKKLTDAAHKIGLKVWSHATVFPSRPSDAAYAKVDAVSHASDLSWELEDSMPSTVYPLPANYSKPRNWNNYSLESEKVNKLIQLMKQNNTALDATVSHTHTRIVLRQLAQPDSLRRNKDPLAIGRFTFGITKKAYQNGISILAGTDYQENPAQSNHPAIHYEMELLVKECGLRNIDAIRAATINVAKVLGAEKDLGTIEKGKLADLVILEKNPLEDIINTKSILYILKCGQVYNRKHLFTH